MDQDFAIDYLQDRGIPHGLSAAAYTIAEYAIAKAAGDAAVRSWIDKRADPLVFVGLDDHAFTWRMNQPLPPGAAVIVFGRGVLGKPGLQAAAVLAHELGHVWLQDHACEPKEPQPRELAADAKAAEWGFRQELASSLAADLAVETDPKKQQDLQARVDALR